jgi:hypothetical protein
MSDDDAARAMRARSGSPFLNPKQAAWYLGISLRHLERLRSRGCGPPFRKHARFVRYHVDDLIRWSESTREILR